MAPNNQNIDNYIKTNMIIFLSALLGQLVIFAVASYLVTQNYYYKTFSFSNDNTILLISGIMVLLFIPLSYFIFKKKLKTIALINNLKEKLAGYKQALLIEYFMIEIPAIYSVIMFFYTKDRIYALFVIILLFYLSRLKPTKENLLIDLNLNENEIEGYAE